MTRIPIFRGVHLLLVTLAMLSAAALSAAKAADPPPAVFAGALDVTDRPDDRRRLSAFAGFVERNTGNYVRIAIQLRAPVSAAKSIFSSWARLDRTGREGKTVASALKPGGDLSAPRRLTVAFCRCDGNLEAPYVIEVSLRTTAKETAPDLSWVDGRLLIRGVFKITGPMQRGPARLFQLSPYTRPKPR